MESALLIHTLGWNLESDVFVVDDGVRLCRTAGSQVERLYHRLCTTQNVDDSDPFVYNTHALFDGEQHPYAFWQWGSPHSVVSRLVTFICFCTASPLRMCRLIVSDDHFQAEAFHSEVIYDSTEETDSLDSTPEYPGDGTVVLRGNSFPVLDPGVSQLLSTCWYNYAQQQKGHDKINHRVENAIAYFFYALRAYSMEHVCLNLAILLESLFAPATANEIAHQVSFNTAHFVASEPERREQVYRQVKRLYNVRSRLVHGGNVDFIKTCDAALSLFPLCADILVRIVGDANALTRFSVEADRVLLLEDWLFGRA